MKNLLSLAFLIFSLNSIAQVGFNNPNPDNSSILDLTSTTKGLLIPRMSTTERNGITSPATGLLVYDTSENGFFMWNGTAWHAILSGAKTAAGVQLAYNLGIGTAPTAGNGITTNAGVSATTGTFSGNVGMANLTATGTATITGNSTFGGTLGVTSNTTIGGTLNATGNTTLGGTLSTTGNTTLGGTLSANATTINGPLTINTTSGGVMLPRLTDAQRNAISSPTTGLMIYNTTSNKVQVYIEHSTVGTIKYNAGGGGPPQLTIDFDPNDLLGSSFSIGFDSYINSITVEVSSENVSIFDNADFIMRLGTGDGFSTPVIASNVRTLDNPGFYTFNFPAYLLSANQTYTFWLEGAGADTNNDIYLRGGAAVVGGKLWTRRNTVVASDASTSIFMDISGTYGSWVNLH